jgi:hypothetical protein
VVETAPYKSLDASPDWLGQSVSVLATYAAGLVDVLTVVTADESAGGEE